MIASRIGMALGLPERMSRGTVSERMSFTRNTKALSLSLRYAGYNAMGSPPSSYTVSTARPSGSARRPRTMGVASTPPGMSLSLAPSGGTVPTGKTRMEPSTTLSPAVSSASA